jgi:hypothetical protein
MKISELTQLDGPWRRFDLNVGGFTIKRCRWNVHDHRILFPLRYSRHGSRHRVIFVHGALVNKLRALLESGETSLPRDRRPCHLNIHFRGWSHGDAYHTWVVFGFTVRGFTILGCRWHPESGSIQLPVTFFPNPGGHSWNRRQVICAYGAHINRLRRALEEANAVVEPAQVLETSNA